MSLKSWAIPRGEEVNNQKRKETPLVAAVAAAAAVERNESKRRSVGRSVERGEVDSAG